MDRNLGGALNFWDHVFGTYQNATEEKLVYGITHSLREDTKVKVPFTNFRVTLSSNNPIKVLFWEYSFLFRDLWYAPTWKDKVIVLFGRPGETFEAPPKTVKADAAQNNPTSAGMPQDAVAA